jgi:hypothetical protein
MNKPLLGIAVGAVLGIVDGATAWFEPKARPEIMTILMGSCVKGMIVGVLSGMYARKVESNAKGVAFGAILGLILAYIVAAIPRPDGEHFYVQIMLPGFILGALIGFLTQRWGAAPAFK